MVEKYKGFSLEAIADFMRKEGKTEIKINRKIKTYQFVLDHPDYSDNPLLKESYMRVIKEIKYYQGKIDRQNE